MFTESAGVMKLNDRLGIKQDGEEFAVYGGRNIQLSRANGRKMGIEFNTLAVSLFLISSIILLFN